MARAIAPRFMPFGRAREARQRAHQRALIQSAVELVAAGASRRVFLVGLDEPYQALSLAQELADGAGVVARALWRESGCDIAIESYG